MSDLEYVLAGHAVFTLQSVKTGQRCTYKMVLHMDGSPDAATSPLYFCYHLSGPDNTSDYKYIGCYYDNGWHDGVHNGTFVPVKQYRGLDINILPRHIRVLYYFLHTQDGSAPPNITLVKSNRCARCGRLLTTPESVERGLGPECSLY